MRSIQYKYYFIFYYLNVWQEFWHLYFSYYFIHIFQHYTRFKDCTFMNHPQYMMGMLQVPLVVYKFLVSFIELPNELKLLGAK
jgi:hypothetical protein